MEAVTVVARFRGAETGDTDFGEWSLTENTIKHNEKHHEFNFDSVLNPSRTQAELYEAAGRKIINFFMDGYNATIFAYGQSGSGKTFSMLGPEEVTEILVNQSDSVPEEVQALFGILPRATFHIFEIVTQGIPKGTKYNLKVSYIEVYNEMINDILANPPNLNLKLREFPNQGMCVIGMIESTTNTPESVFEAISSGTANRVVCSTGQNARSSRSHTVFIISLEQTLADGTVKISKINLVDLAGSEKLSKTGAQGQALKEAQKINLSLTTLGRCIKALTSGGSEHVPYRESKLTLILKESLSGAAMTTLIVTGSMRKVHQEETISTMQFAERAKMVKTSAKKNAKRSYEELEKLFTKLSEEVKILKSGIKTGGPVSIESLANENVENSRNAQEFEELQQRYEELQQSSMKEIENLKKKIEKANEDIEKIDYLAIREEMDELNDQLAADNSKLEKVSKEKDAERQEFESEINKISEKIEETQSKLFQTQQELQLTDKQILLLNSQVDDKNNTALELENKALELQKKIREYENLIIEKNDELAEIIEKNFDLEAESSKIKQLIEENKNLTESIKDSIDKIEKESQETEAKVLLLQKTETLHIQEIEKLKVEKETLAQESSGIYTQKQVKDQETHNKTIEKYHIREQILKKTEEINEELHKVKQNISELSSSEFLDELNRQKTKYAEELSEPILKEIDLEKHEKANIMTSITDLTKELETHKENTEKNQTKNSKLKQDFKTGTIDLNKVIKEFNDENSSKIRITKNIKAIEVSLAKAISEAEKITKAEMQLKITDYIQTVNITRNKIEEKDNNSSKFLKSYNEEIENIKKEIELVTNEKITLEKAKKQAHDEGVFQEKNFLSEKAQIFSEISERNIEISKLKEIISANESEINRSETLIVKLESDVRHKEAERDVERKNTMRKTIIPRKMSIVAPLAKQEPTNKGFMPTVILKKTNNKFLIDAINESEKAKQNNPNETPFKVSYELQAIKALYPNIDDCLSRVRK